MRTLKTLAITALALTLPITGVAALGWDTAETKAAYEFPAELSHPAATGEYVTTAGEVIPVDPTQPLPAAVIEDLRDALPVPLQSDAASAEWHRILAERVAAVETSGRHPIVIAESGWSVAPYLVTYPEAVREHLEFAPAILSWDNTAGAREDAQALVDALGEGWEVIDLTR